MPETELEPLLDNSDDVGGKFEDALKRTLFDKQILQLQIEAIGKFEGDFGQYWKLKAKLLQPATDIDGEAHPAGEVVTLLLNVPRKDASDGQWKAYNARLAEIQVNAIGVAKPDRSVNMKTAEGKRVAAQVSVYTNEAQGGKQKQQVDRFLKATV